MLALLYIYLLDLDIILKDKLKITIIRYIEQY